MQAHRNRRGDEPRKPAPSAEGDFQLEAAVLALLLAEHPAELSFDAIPGPRNAGKETAVARAVSRLAADGLVRCPDFRTVAPCRAALRARQLFGELE